MAKKKMMANVVEQTCLQEGIYSLRISCREAAQEARPGQFLSLYSADASRLLPRPISICEIDQEAGELRLVYRVAGEGTKEFSELKSGDTIPVIGPLGNGFPLDRMTEGKTALLVGGGIGVPPMVELSRQLPGKKLLVMGYRNKDTFLSEELAENGDLFFATDDGSLGTRGTVIDAIRENKLQADVIFSCGPTPMLRALKAYAEENGMECWISMEERMACGIGACLACVCKSKEIDSHSMVHNKRICKDGPVFLASEVEL